LLEKWLQRSGFLVVNRASMAQNRKFPAKFPVSRQFAWRLVRSALLR
jgi:hypothetical protein